MAALKEFINHKNIYADLKIQVVSRDMLLSSAIVNIVYVALDVFEVVVYQPIVCKMLGHLRP